MPEFHDTYWTTKPATVAHTMSAVFCGRFSFIGAINVLWSAFCDTEEDLELAVLKSDSGVACVVYEHDNIGRVVEVQKLYIDEDDMVMNHLQANLVSNYATQLIRFYQYLFGGGFANRKVWAKATIWDLPALFAAVDGRGYNELVSAGIHLDVLNAAIEFLENER